MPYLCHGQPAIEIVATVAVSGTSQTNLKWTFTGDAHNDPTIGLKPNGDFDFHAKSQPIHVTLTLQDPDPNVVFYQGGAINVFGYADSYADGYAQVLPVPLNHPQIHDIQLGPDRKTVSFCYANHTKPGEPGNPNHYQVSRYTIYFGDVATPAAWLPYWVDPRTNNGP
jgi:hypothetical protein